MIEVIEVTEATTFDELPELFREWANENYIDDLEVDWVTWYECWKHGYYLGLNDGALEEKRRGGG